VSLDRKPFDRIDESDIQSLIANNQSEGKTIEYKRELRIKTDSDKKEFLSDVSSFANASGGHMIIGIEENEGQPTRLVGLDGSDIDAEKRKLDNLILQGIEPRMVPPHQIREVRLPDKQRHVIIIRINKSLTAPHMVSLQKTNKFYSRNSHGKYLLDVGEIRNLFLLSEDAIDRIRNFRSERLGRIIAGDTPIPVEDRPKMAVHTVPLSISDPSAIFDLEPIIRNNIDLVRRPPLQHRMERRLNFDGYLTYCQDPSESSAYRYAQLFRNGSIEFVEVSMAFNGSFIPRPFEDPIKAIASIRFEQELIDALRNHLYILRILNVNPPFFVMISLLGVKGYSMIVEPEYGDLVPRRDGIDRNDLILPEIQIEDSANVDVPTLLKSSFDMIWNAAGWPASQNYDKEGVWRG
jgi:hypothetical protein